MTSGLARGDANDGASRGNSDAGGSRRRSCDSPRPDRRRRRLRSVSVQRRKSPNPCGVAPGHGFLNPFPGTWWARSCVTIIPNYKPACGAVPPRACAFRSRSTGPGAAGAASYTAPHLHTFTPMRQPAVRAPEFPEGLDWIHTGGRPLTLADFRGKILLLDFWTYG